MHELYGSLPVCRGLSVPLAPYNRSGQRLCRDRCRAEPVRKGNGEKDPLAELCPVPSEQQPVKELQALQDVFAFNWATLPLPQFLTRLGMVWGGFFATMGLPVSAVTFNPQDQPIEFFASAGLGSLCVVTVVVLRLYLGWSHVGNRLLSATCEYEESGWYDGQIWVKPPQYLARDRLLGTYTVRPALARLRTTLLGLAGVLCSFSSQSDGGTCITMQDRFRTWHYKQLFGGPSTGMAVVLTAALAQPQQAGARIPVSANLASSSSSSISSSTASSRPLKPQPEYWDLVRKFEPWVLDDPDLPEEIRQKPAADASSVQHPLAHHFRPDAPIISYSD
ncbi:hypothetical protein WJX74_007611 [Apatococcus lobatus]|uniref:Uncharacterized protein n=1 Tax=Apatococcus lobatus TaxID=904363 RepID=A0AAW1SB23_9CHLO